MLFLFVSMLLLAGVVLALTIRFLKSRHLQITRSWSLSKKMQSSSPFSGNSSCQTCHLCGGLRLRTPHVASFDHSDVSKSQSRHLDEAASGQSRLIQHQWVAMRTQILLSMKQAVCKLISHQKKQAHVDYAVKLANLRNFLNRKTSPHARDLCVASEGSFGSSTDSLLSTFVDGQVSNAINVAAINETDKVVAQETERSTETHLQGAPVHRVVLEISVSSSGNSNESNCAINPGITLKLETSKGLGRLAGCAEALKNKDSKKCEHTSDKGQVLHESNDVLPKTLGSSYAHCNQTSQRFIQNLKETILLPKDEIKSSDFVTTELETADKDPALDSMSLNKNLQVFNGLKECPRCCHILGNITEGESPTSATGKSYAMLGQLKLRSSDCLHGSAISDVAMQHMVGNPEGLEMAPRVHISVLKFNEQETADVNSQAGSILASLNVTDKLTDGISLSSVKKEKSNNKVYVIPDTNSSHNSASFRASEPEGVREESSMKEEDYCPPHGSVDTSSIHDSSPPFKRSKKKRKPKGKRPKANTDPLVVDAKEMQEIGKVVLESSKHVSPFSERELGCVCGTLKGNLHSESCPYPFISSSSILQRKMREHYNLLVRSNAAKTLTLAQVGQFTSCLVEAKATLRHKSESIQRKYTITKALLSKADKSSFDWLCSQVYGLEMEQKKLEEDTVVYNRLQEQLKLSPAYQKMLEYGRAHFELQPHTGQMMEKMELEESEMSFEEFLEQEKKDAFWQRHNLARSGLSSG